MLESDSISWGKKIQRFLVEEFHVNLTLLWETDPDVS